MRSLLPLSLCLLHYLSFLVLASGAPVRSRHDRPSLSPNPHHSAFDLLIYAATPGGIATAVSASRFSSSLSLPLSVVILESTAHIGGMSAAGGIGLRDLGVEDSINNTIAHQWTLRAARHYNVTHPVYQPWMNVSTALFEELLAEANVTVITSAPLSERSTAVVKDGSRLVSVETVDGRVFQANVFVDASYEGDLMVRAGVSHTYGREARAQYGEANAGVQAPTAFGNFLTDHPVSATYSLTNDSLIPLIDATPLPPIGSADVRVMAYSYRLCVTPNKSIQTPFPRPSRYDESRYLLLQRYIDSLVASGKHPEGPTLGDLVDIFPYRGFPPGDKFDLCDSPDSAVTSDAVNLNAGYVNGSYAERRRIEAEHLQYLLGMLWYLGHAEAVPSQTRNSTLAYGLCNDQWVDNDYLPPLMYIREATRLVNDAVLTQVNLLRGVCHSDSIALGSWGYDVHLMSRTAVRGNDSSLIAHNEGQLVGSVSGSGPAVYEVPYGSVVPRIGEASNLLVPVNLATTHVTFSSLRVEPHWMHIGEGCGIAAVLAVRDGVAVQKVNVTAVQEVLKARGVLFHYPTTKCDSRKG